MWGEVCALAQRADKPGILRAVPPQARKTTTADIFGRGDFAEKVCHDVIWYEDGNEREGIVALIATDREGGNLKAYVLRSEPTQTQTEEPWIELSIDELQQAIDTKKCQDERLYLRLREMDKSNPPTRHASLERPFSDAEDEKSAIQRNFAEAGYVMERPTNAPNALLYCLAGNALNADTAHLETHCRILREQMLTYAQQHEDTYKRRIRIPAVKETQAMRTEAWQAWTQSIIKTSHRLDELEADILGAMGYCPAIGMWNASQKKPMLMTYSRGGGEKMTQIDTKQRPEENEAHFPVRLGQGYYARATRQRALPSSYPKAAPAPSTNEGPAVMEDANASTLREQRPRSDALQTDVPKTPDDSAGVTQRAAEAGSEHPRGNHTAASQAGPDQEDAEVQVAEAFRILLTYRLPADNLAAKATTNPVAINPSVTRKKATNATAPTTAPIAAIAATKAQPQAIQATSALADRRTNPQTAAANED